MVHDDGPLPRGHLHRHGHAGGALHRRDRGDRALLDARDRGNLSTDERHLLLRPHATPHSLVNDGRLRPTDASRHAPSLVRVRRRGRADGPGDAGGGLTPNARPSSLLPTITGPHDANVGRRRRLGNRRDRHRRRMAYPGHRGAVWLLLSGRRHERRLQQPRRPESTLQGCSVRTVLNHSLADLVGPFQVDLALCYFVWSFCSGLHTKKRKNFFCFKYP